MEKKSTAGTITTSNQTDPSSDSPPTKRAKQQPEGHLSPVATTSNTSTDPDVHLLEEEHLRHESTVSTDTTKPPKDEVYNFFLPSEEECNSDSKENLEPNSAGLKSSRTGGVWQKSLEESHSARINERSLLGHLLCPEGTQKQIPESDIFHILGSEGVTEVGALYKVSPSKFILVFGSKMAKEELENTVIQCRFGKTDITLSFRKRIEPIKDGREPIFVTIKLPEYISDQAVKIAFSHFGEVLSVFKGRHKFNRKIRNCKRHVRGGGSLDTAEENCFPWWYYKRCPLCRKGGVVLQVQNPPHAWRELPCSFTHPRRL